MLTAEQALQILIFKITFTYVCKWECPYAACHGEGMASRSQDGNVEELVLSFCPVGLGTRTQVTGLGGKCFNPLSHLTRLVP